MGKDLIARVAKTAGSSAQYAAKYAEVGYLWDELAAVAWLDPSLVTKWKRLYVDVNVDHGAGYGETLVWVPGQQPGLGEQLAEVQQDLDNEKFYREFVELLKGPKPARIPGRSCQPASP
jgi:inosine-uridine nucleoside N-ribohydrolase